MSFCTNCGSRISPTDVFCSACGEQTKAAKPSNTASNTQQTSNPQTQGAEYPRQTYTLSTKLFRSRNDRVIAGVCGGIAKQYNIDPNLVRLGFIIFSIIYGTGVLVYILLAILLPEEPLNYQ